MNIFITQRLTTNQHGAWIDSLELTYSQLFTKLGGIVIPIPNAIGAAEASLNNLKPDRIVLSGGGNIGTLSEKDPSQGQLRERTERVLLDYAVEKNIPVLGLCRGLQFINIYFNGSLCSNIHEIVENHKPGSRHQIKLTENSILEKLGKKNNFECNSYHDQGVLAEGLSQVLREFARCSSIIEGLFHPELAIAGIQWHPERESKLSDLDKLILCSFINKELFWASK